MYRQILVFSDAQGKSITWRLSVKKNIPVPERLTYTGRVLVRFVGVYGDKNGSTMGNINQKVAQGFIRRAQILFMKVKWEHQNAARKA